MVSIYGLFHFCLTVRIPLFGNMYLKRSIIYEFNLELIFNAECSKGLLPMGIAFWIKYYKMKSIKGDIAYGKLPKVKQRHCSFEYHRTGYWPLEMS